MPKSTSKPIHSQSSNNPFQHITATSQQTRFHVDTLESQTEIDLHGVGIAIGERELLVDVELRLKAGTRYALVGR
jgi:ABC-type transport system involved in cytochrome bd biosynthesis fused ATPase/permease subunit